jgi:cyclase
MAINPYRKTLHELGGGNFAYVQHDGSWGWSNSGLVVDGDQALLVDTLFDLRLTREMLDAYARVTSAPIGVVVNSHANGDHTYGNQLVPNAKIVASRRCAEEMLDTPPEAMARMLRAAPRLGRTGAFFQRIFGPFHFDEVTLTLPTRTFDGELRLRVGRKEVRLIEVGPAHTRGDTIVWLPGERIVYTADILFVGAHPIMWAGPAGNWIKALDLILGLDVQTIVPGHGPLTDKAHVREIKGYFEYLDREARARYDAGIRVMEAARDISFADYTTWGEAERVAVNVAVLYREYAGDASPLERSEAMAMMAELDAERPAR